MSTATKSKFSIQDMCVTALMAAVLCVVAPWSIPIGPISITLGSFIVYLTAILIGKWRGTLSVLLYLLLGAIGLPVFSGAAGGVAKLVGPTGGYLIGYLFTAVIVGIAADLLAKKQQNVVLSLVLLFLSLIVGTAVLYAFGTAWYMIQSGNNLATAMGYCVLPFIPLDLIKMVVATAAGFPLRRRLQKANLV